MDASSGVALAADALIAFVEKFNEYGIIVHDGGQSMVGIAYCPWCGSRLPDSERDRWFDELEGKGIDPVTGAIPPEYETAAWRTGRLP